MELTVGILSYNTRDLTVRCIESILKHTKKLTYEIVVIDNASRDGSADEIKKKFPQVKLIVNKKNNYFAAGYNQIIKKASGKYFIMLNSDTYLQNNAFIKLLNFMKEKRILACEGLELRPSLSPIPTGTRFRTLRSDFYELSIVGRFFKNERYLNENKMTNVDRRENFEIEVGCNAYFCIELDLLKKIGGYDENFVLYYTEDDLCQRIKRRKYKIFHFGGSHIVHEDGKSAMQLGWKRIDYFYKDMYVYHSMYNGRLKASLLYLLLACEKYILLSWHFFKNNH